MPGTQAINEKSQVTEKQQEKSHARIEGSYLDKLCEPIKIPPFELMLTQLKIINSRLNLEKGLSNILERSEKELKIAIPIVMDDGHVEVFTGYRVQHNSAMGPCVSGMRYHLDLTLDELKALATWLSWKCAAANIHCGGAMGGIICDLNEMTKDESKRLVNAYFERIPPFSQGHEDIFISGSDESNLIPRWDGRRLGGSKIHNAVKNGLKTSNRLGKATDKSGIDQLGLTIITKEVLNQLNRETSQVSIAIHGLLLAASKTAASLAEEGHKVIALGDSSKGFYDQKGLDLADIENYANVGKDRVLENCNRKVRKRIFNQDLLSLNTDLLILTSQESQLTEKNAAQVQAKFVVEGADGLITPEAALILLEKGTQIVPDILTTAGNILVPYLKWMQKRDSEYRKEENIEKNFIKILCRSFNEAWTYSQEESTSLRMATLMLAVKRVAEATRKRDILPQRKRLNSCVSH